MVFPEGLRSTTETHKPPNILGQKDIFIPHLRTLLAMGTSASQDQEYKDTLDKITSLWGGLPQKRPDSADLLAQASGLTITGETLKGAGIARNSKDMTFDGCVVYGDYVLMRSIRPAVRNSLVFGFKIGGGSNILRLYQLHPDPVNVLKNGLYERINSPDAKKKLGGFLLFASGCLPEELVRFITANPDLIQNFYDTRINPLRDLLRKNQKLFDTTAYTEGQQGKYAAAAAYEIETLLQLFAAGDTYHIEVDNSLLLGGDVLALVKGGRISRSILAGNLLEGAHVRVSKSWLIDQDGNGRFVEEETFGQPEEHLEIPSFFK